MRISLIVAAEADLFHHKRQDPFASIAAQTYPHDDLELIFVDAHANASIAAAVTTFRLRNPTLSTSLLRCVGPARAVGYNRAAARASGELLIFLADDFEPWPDLVVTHATYHALNSDPNAVGIGPGLFPDAIRQDFFARWQEDSGQLFGVPMRGAAAGWNRAYFYGGNASIKKSKFDSLGGFDERFRYHAWDDYEFGLRWAASGGYSQFLAAAVATHQHTVSLDERCAAMEQSGESAWLLQRLHPRLDHAWLAILERRAQLCPAIPAKDAPKYAWIAFYTEQLEVAFRRGYRSALAHHTPPSLQHAIDLTGALDTITLIGNFPSQSDPVRDRRTTPQKEAKSGHA
jgi:GT2 family glycosyltransferase